MSIASRDNFYLRQFDVKISFLYGILKEDIYMKQPESLDNETSRVCNLLKICMGENKLLGAGLSISLSLLKVQDLKRIRPIYVFIHM